jgi:hypothetical protein
MTTTDTVTDSDATLQTVDDPAPHDNDRLCGAHARQSGDRCGRPAGWGTRHPGFGRCKLHGGASPNGTIAAARDLGHHLAAELERPDMDPADALLEGVMRATAVVRWLTAKCALADDPAAPELKVLRDWQHTAVQVASAAVAAGIEERKVRVAEDIASRLNRALDAVLADLGIDADDPVTVRIIERRLLELVA